MTTHKYARVLCGALMLFCGSVAVAGAQARNGSSTVPPDTGILLMAHGGSTDWNAQVRAVASKVNAEIPTEVALGMADRGTLQQGVDALEARGVKRIVAVPLFVSSHSSVIESTKYLLGLRPDAPKELADFAMDPGMHGMAGMPAGRADASAAHVFTPPLPVTCRVPLVLAPALDRHPIVADILADRAAAISKDPAHAVVVLVAHGPNDDRENGEWLADMGALAKLLSARAAYARIEYVTLRDDAAAGVRDRATADLRRAVQSANDAGYHALVVPLLLSYGGIESGLRQRLDGLEHTLATAGLLPDPRIVAWVVDSANSVRR